MESIKHLIDNSKGVENFKRVDSQHPVAWFVGRDAGAQISLFCIVDKRPSPIKSSKLVNVFSGRRNAGDYAITFSLLDETYLDLFVLFCQDMIDYSRRIKEPNDKASAIRSRYLQWQTIFSERKGEKLSFSEIKGLIGELLFLKQYLVPRYGFENAMSYWSGIESTVQDFYCNDTWYEIKTKSSGGTSVKISSVEQLDSNSDGHLVVVTLDKTSQGDTNGITLNSLYNIIMDDIDDPDIADVFKARLIKYGYYPDDYYDEPRFRLNGFTFYRVDSTFPCIRRSQLPDATQRVKYELLLPEIAAFEEKDNND